MTDHISALRGIYAAVLARRVLWIAFLTVILMPSWASAETRTLKVYFVHTKERAEITFKKDGRYLQSGLNQLNRFLRDWRRGEPTKMDPRLFDLVWQVHKASGSREYIHVLSAYRSPATNSMLRTRSRGVAKKSQHMLGKAMDFYIPGVPLKKLRALGMRYQAGGVGYYPTSGSPFVHMDVGNVRSWPRMSRRELLALFPGGKTLHIPTDGKPLPGYEAALAAYEARKGSGDSIMVASAPRKSKSLLAMLFGGGGADEEEDVSESGGAIAVASAARPSRAAPRAAVAEEEAPTPAPVAPVRTPAAPRLPEPQPQQAILAALPPREAPQPLGAPRPAVSVDPTPEEQAALAFAVPVPGSKPQIALAMAAPPPNTLVPPAPGAGYVPSAAAVVETAATQGAVAAEPTPMLNGFVPVPVSKPRHSEPAMMLAAAVVPAPRPEPQPDMAAPAAVANETTAGVPEPSKRDEIAQMVAAHADTPAFPLPQSAPPRPQQLAYAAAPQERPAARQALDVIAVPQEPDELERDARERVEPVVPARLNPARPVQRETPAKAISAVNTGVRTTAKGAKPQSGQGREPEAIVQAANAPVSRMAISSTPVSRAAPVKGTALRNDALRAAPTTVYTAGFQPSLPSDNANRFSGKAVTFLSIAKFPTTN